MPLPDLQKCDDRHNTGIGQTDRMVKQYRPLCTMLASCWRAITSSADKSARRHVMSSCKIWWRSDDARQIYCVLSIFKMAAVRHLFDIFAIFVKNSNLRLYLRRHAKYGEDRTMRGRVIAHFRFSKWRPFGSVSLVWCHSGPHNNLCLMVLINILLKMHVDPVNILRDIAIFTRTTYT